MNKIDNEFLILYIEVCEWGDFSVVQKNFKKFYFYMVGFDCFICCKIYEI